MGIGKNVKFLREKRKLTLDAVALAVGTDPQAISQMEKRGSKTSSFAPKLAQFFGVDLAALMGDDTEALAGSSEVETRPPSQRLQWVSDREAELLSHYRACAEAERSTIDSIAKSLPKVSFERLGSDQG